MSEPNQAAVDHLQLLRANLRNASPFIRDALAHNADACVKNALGMVDPTPEIERLSSELVATARRFSRDLESESYASEEVENGRQGVAAAIDALEQALRAAPPSQLARALGY